ncbi:MAG TPA: CoA transferase [Kribbella sp.]|uniref:CaiB/BaiF CoA transferase family protein n=1 Tax=Kribbella sp. TaxID=1871183 RepID=UPI002D771B3D|nr:CoA transferase [Kribbella sp.]HET6298442.1 CoA transferase [Kribbella sp.]
MAQDSALAGLRVLDLSDNVGGQYCARTLADFGADVLLIEGVDGSPVRRAAAWTAARPPAVDAMLFRHLNTGKQSMTLDWRSPEGMAVLTALAADSDVVVAGEQAVCRALMAVNPRLVACAITDFGAGPHEGWTGTEMIFQALSGVMLLNGEYPKPPLYGLGARAQYSAGITAYGAILAALLWREQSGRGQFVETAVLDSVAVMNAMVSARYFYNGTFQARLPRSGLVGLFRCSDGWVVVYAARPNDWAGCCAVFELPEHAQDPRFVDLADRLKHWPEALELIGAQAATMTCDEVTAAGRQCKLPVSRVMDGPALWADKHLNVRGFWQRARSGDASHPVIAPAFRMSATPRAEVVTTAPGLGEEDRQALGSVGLSDQHQTLQANGVMR